MLPYETRSYRSPALRRHSRYGVHLPRDPANAHVIMFLHGSAECGDDIEKVVHSHGPLHGTRRGAGAYVIVVPQLPKRLHDDRRDWLNFADDIDLILRDVSAQYGVRTDAPCLTGISLGACGAWELAAEKVRAWRAVAPFAGGANDNSWPDKVAKRISDTPVWAFVNRREYFPELVSETKAMVDAVEKAGGVVRHTYFDNT